ncbi:hypothetical protein SPI_03193 [Niveomyces insectorum RCEF 264]|uniref:Uncharacterized protein n=1 Tax=Niveomyces insectorum RCEF 264 TaxID=1081102 RepID=A0A167X5A7_9HYPO|nr:hypothetical protein SPI_03193 [Niveomyces insectorum RCEF 264]
MSNRSTASPRLRPTRQANEPQLPAGHCRYIMLMPELKGHRCGCAHFNLNRSVPGAICECGHLSCYHVSSGEPPSKTETQEMGLLKQRLELLEREHVELHQLRRDVILMQEHMGQNHDRSQAVLVRVSQLEETVEKSRAEIDVEIQAACKNLGRAWDAITDLMHHKTQTDARFRHIDDHLHSVDSEVARIGERQLELVDVDISLEERIDNLETLEDRIEALESNEGRGGGHGGHPHSRGNSHVSRNDAASSPHNRRARRTASSSPPPIDDNTRLQVNANSRSRSPSQSPRFLPDSTTPTPTPPAAGTFSLDAATRAAAAASSFVVDGHRRSPAHHHATLLPALAAPLPPAVMALRAAAHTSGSSSSELWTLHVSLLPTSTQPFPFERGTNAYKRCLSRGLHQMVAVNGTSAEAFAHAITKAFGRILRGRTWVPLQALPCTAERLAGLPMLRPLDPSLMDRQFNLKFLKDHCAVCDSNGKMDSLYISMRDKTLSWHSIRRLPVFLDGLEPSWAYDPLLDANDSLFLDDDENPDAGSSEDEAMGGMTRPPAGDIVATLPSLKRAASEMSRSSSFGSASATAPALALAPASASSSAPAPTSNPAAPTSATTAAEGEGSRPKVPRICPYPLPNIVEVRRSVKTS